MRGLRQLNAFHKTSGGNLVFGLAELAAAYGLLLRAFDSGNILLYIATLVLSVGALQNFAKLVWKVAHGFKTRRA